MGPPRSFPSPYWRRRGNARWQLPQSLPVSGLFGLPREAWAGHLGEWLEEKLT